MSEKNIFFYTPMKERKINQYKIVKQSSTARASPNDYILLLL
jgi:hypothetical protein